MTARQYQVPPQLEPMLLEFTVNVLVSQPADLAAFAVRYFSRLRRGSSGSTGVPHQLTPGDRIPSRRGSAASDHSSVFSEDEGENVPGLGAVWDARMTTSFSSETVNIWSCMDNGKIMHKNSYSRTIIARSAWKAHGTMKPNNS